MGMGRPSQVSSHDTSGLYLSSVTLTSETSDGIIGGIGGTGEGAGGGDATGGGGGASGGEGGWKATAKLKLCSPPRTV